MFKWYQNARKCYVYLPDVSTKKRTRAGSGDYKWKSSFRNSRWFTRGWTLEELIAPPVVEFFSIEGKKLGDKRSLERQIHQIIGIFIDALQGKPPAQVDDKQRFWGQQGAKQPSKKTRCTASWAFLIHVYH